MKQINLFENQNKESKSLFVLYNNEVAQIPLNKIFDTEKYSDFRGVSYVSSPNFFIEHVKNFDMVTFILGIDNTDNLKQFSDGITPYIKSENRVNFFNELPDDVKNQIIENKIKIRYGKHGVMIHDKIYLLSNDNAHEYRVITDSANFSQFIGVDTEDDLKLVNDIYAKMIEDK